MSRNKDVLLEERIEKIRRKNEEIKRRHLEVEADKQYAAKLNALVQPRAQTEDWTSGWSAPVVKHKHYEREVPESHQSSPQASQTPKSGRRREQNGVESQRFSKQNGKCYVFTEKDGPPPDPVYNFLADSTREPGGEWPVRRGNRQGEVRGSTSRQRDRERAQPRKESRHSNHTEYEAWRAERNRIDQDRINRQKTAEGLWRREWDNEKVAQDFEEDQAFRGSVSRQPQGRIGSGRFSSSSVESYHNGSDGSGSSPRILIHGGRRLQSITLSDDGEASITSARTSPPNKRNISKVDGGLTISIVNTACPPTTGPLQRVRVKPPTAVGSGRVGPRHKARISYSSQSDDEQHSPQRATQTVDSTPSAPTRNIAQTVKFNTASLRPPLPPATTRYSSGPRKQRDDLAGNRQSRKRNMRGDYSKKEERRTDSTGSSLGNDSEEGVGDESWEDVTTSGAESACETSEDKAKNSMSKTQRGAESSIESQTSRKSEPVNGEGIENISNEQQNNCRANESTEGETSYIDGLPVSDSSYVKSCNPPNGHDVGNTHNKEQDMDEYFVPINNKDVGSFES